MYVLQTGICVEIQNDDVSVIWTMTVSVTKCGNAVSFMWNSVAIASIWNGGAISLIWNSQLFSYIICY